MNPNTSFLPFPPSHLPPQATYEINEFADLTEDEFAGKYLSRGLNVMADTLADAPLLEDVAGVQGSFTSVDWTTKGAVTPVKNQGQCGSCWAFSTTGNVEGQLFQKSKKLVSLSEQQLVDCDTKGQDQGCQGGLPSNGAAYIKTAGGLDTESDYPYTGTGGTCKFDKSKVAATITGWSKVSTDENQIAAQLNKVGPLSIGINAGPMQFYSKGVSCPWKILCNPKSLDHGVLIVGVGTDSGKDYWKIKNSWGTSWGEDGYYRICKDKGACGLNTMVGTVTM